MELTRHRPKPALAVALVAVALVAAACGGGGSKAAKGKGQVQDTLPTPTTVPPIFPLTGMPAGDAAKLARPAVAVKIDNIAVARPQAGLDKADVVYEEITEGITRFIVVFQSTDADSIGPVRSVRPADPLVVKPLGGLLTFSGGAPAILDLVKAANVATVTENDTDTLKRRSDRQAPHNLYTSTEALYRKAKPDAKAPPAFASFRRAGTPFAGAGAVPATKIALSPAPGVKANYDFDQASATYKRSTDGTPHLVEGGGQVAPANVIVQFTTYNAFDKDPKVSVPQVLGSGDAVFFSGGMMVKGKWSKPSPESVTTFTDATGAPVALAPGPTWVQLQAPGTSVTTS